MATAPQAAMEMPQQGANPFADPNTMAVYDQLRQSTSPKEFGDEMLAGASQADPQAVAEFLQELQGLNMPPEVLDALNDVVDEILASPERYPELRQQYMEQGLPEEILPEQFDPQFFAALNMAIDQMIAAPTGVQSFAQGGIAELKPIAKAIASYGRNGDTMLAHITPAEARMLRRRGGSGTINPDTGLPEFFLKKLFKGVGNALKSVGNAVKKFANSTVGKIVTTVALGFFLGPAAASFLNISSVAGVAAVSGFVGSAGATLLGGGNIGDALKAGAVGGLTAGAGAGIMGGSGAFASGSYTGPTTIGGQFDKFKGMLPGSSPSVSLAEPPPPVQADVPVDGGTPASLGANQAPVDVTPKKVSLNLDGTRVNPGGLPNGAPAPDLPGSDPLGDFIKQNDAARAAANTPARMPGSGVTPYKPTTIGESFSKIGEGLGMGDKPASYETFKQGAGELFSPTGPSPEQIDARALEMMSKNPKLPFDTAVKRATSELAPGIFRTYAPAAVAGLGALAAFGGFDSKPAESGPITKSLMKPVTQRIAEEGTQRQMYLQGLPGVVYDDKGAPVYGQSTRLPTYDVPDYNSGGYGLPQEQGRMFLPPVYIPPPNTIGSRSVAQPYNTSDMYPNLVPRQYAEGGYAVSGYAKGGPITDLYRSVLNRDPNEEDIKAWTGAFGTEVDELELARFRREAAPELAAIQTAQGVQAAEQKAARDAAAQQRAMRRSQGSGQMYSNINAGLAALAPETNPMVATDTGFGARNRAAGLGALQTAYNPMLQRQRDAMSEQAAILARGPSVVPSGMPFSEQPFPMPRFTNEGKQPFPGDLPPGYPTRQPSGIPVGFTPMPTPTGMGGIAALAQGGYPRRTGQINGPGTEKSDSIPAMLSDGEFVMTAKAVRGAGKGSRRAGAKKMYALMHRLEKNSERG